MGWFCWSMLPECYLRAHVNPLDWRSPCADFRPVPEASPTTALLLSVGGGSVSESNRSAAFGPLSGFEDHAHHRMKYAPEYSLAAARTSHGNEPVETFWATPNTDSESAATTHKNLQFVLHQPGWTSVVIGTFQRPYSSVPLSLIFAARPVPPGNL